MPALLAALALASSVPLDFMFDGCQTPTAANRLSTRTLAKVLRDPRFAGTRFIVEGHAARTGDRAEEMAVSERLANDVMDRLIYDGVPRSQLVVRGYGAERSKPGELPEDYANCRVEVVEI